MKQQALFVKDWVEAQKEDLFCKVVMQNGADDRSTPPKPSKKI